MFGNKNRIIQEEITEMREKLANNDMFFNNVKEKKEIIEADYNEIEESKRIIETSLNQLYSNVDKVSEFSNDNLREISQLGESIIEIEKQADENLANLQNASNEIAKQFEATCTLVEENKHFTSPSKYLTEVPNKIKDHNRNYMQIAEQMSDYSKQMSVLALNAAIEAGRLGESGKAFVNAAEDVRVASNDYISLIENLKQEVSASNDEVAALQEQVSRLVALLKENNIKTAKLMKQGMSVNKEFSKCDEISSELLEGYRQHLITLKNTQEEIAKYEERNKLTIEDIKTEIDTQSKNSGEIKEALQSVYSFTNDTH